jgi:CRISPR-associated protein Csd2
MNSHSFTCLLEVVRGNPNGDPDANGRPRQFSGTGYGYITPQCIKRKIRNYVSATYDNDDTHDIYIRPEATLNARDEEAFAHAGIDVKKTSKAKADMREKEAEARRFMLERYFDIRAFGAVMTTFTKNNMRGSITGPVQIGYATSIEPIDIEEIALTRTAITTERDKNDKNTEMGTNYIIPYALYRFYGTVSAGEAKKTGFDEDDLELLWQALENMFACDMSASRPQMCTRSLIVFDHNSTRLRASYATLDALLRADRIDKTRPATRFEDYDVSFDAQSVPDDITATVRI